MLQIHNEFNNRQEINDHLNAYIIVLGFSTSPATDPVSFGIERNNWLKRVLSSDGKIHLKDPLEENYDFKGIRNKNIRNISTACEGNKNISNECLLAFHSQEDVLKKWLDQEQWLFDRYVTLINLNHYQETIPINIDVFLPPYQAVFDGQKLLFIQAWLLAKNNPDIASKLLDQDLKFWRMVLSNSDNLITKMISTAAISKNFKFGNIILRQLPNEEILEYIPTSWRNPLSQNESSLRRALIGEWFYINEILKSIDNENYDYLFKNDHYLLSNKFTWKLIKPFWKLQDSRNNYAEMLLKLANIYETTLPSIPNAKEKGDVIRASYSDDLISMYNFIGGLILSVHESTYYEYKVRVTDLEGMRRAVLLAAELRSKNVLAEDIDRELLTNTIREPYWNRPFSWDGNTRSIIFIGLEPNEIRNIHSFIY